MKENTEKAREIAIDFIEILEKFNVEAGMWNKIKNFIDCQYEKEKNKSKLKCNKNALENLANGQIW